MCLREPKDKLAGWMGAGLSGKGVLGDRESSGDYDPGSASQLHNASTININIIEKRKVAFSMEASYLSSSRYGVGVHLPWQAGQLRRHGMRKGVREIYHQITGNEVLSISGSGDGEDYVDVPC